MAWWQKVLYGVDPEEEQKRQDELDAAIRAENERDYAPGGSAYNKTVERAGVEAADKQWREVQERMNASRIPDVEAEIDAAWAKGIEEGLENTTGAIRGTIAAPFEFTFKAIPWQLWAVGLVLLLLYMGAGQWLKGRFLR